MNDKLNCSTVYNDILDKKSKKIHFLGKGSYGIVFKGKINNGLEEKNISVKFISKKKNIIMIIHIQQM